MYHKVSGTGVGDDMTMPVLLLERQFHYLKQEGYTTILMSELLDHVVNKTTLPARPLLITFDDGYADNYTHLYPLLQQYGFKATIFLVAAFVKNAVDRAADTNKEYLCLEEIRSMDPTVVEFGLHSYDHSNYDQLSTLELGYDIRQCKELLQSMDIPFQPCIAFPYGAYPRRDRPRQQSFFNTLQKKQVALAFRIGNRLNRLPFRNPLLIQRLDIKGNMSFEKFIKLIKNGKALFH